MAKVQNNKNKAIERRSENLGLHEYVQPKRIENKNANDDKDEDDWSRTQDERNDANGERQNERTNEKLFHLFLHSLNPLFRLFFESTENLSLFGSGQSCLRSCCDCNILSVPVHTLRAWVSECVCVCLSYMQLNTNPWDGFSSVFRLCFLSPSQSVYALLTLLQR